MLLLLITYKPEYTHLFIQVNTIVCVCVFPQGPGSLLEPCVCILRKLVFADPSLRHRLAEQNVLLLALLRGTFTTLSPAPRSAEGYVQHTQACSSLC